MELIQRQVNLEGTLLNILNLEQWEGGGGTPPFKHKICNKTTKNIVQNAED
jgi:hypothetical protein